MAEIINYKKIGAKNRHIDHFIKILRFRLAGICCEKNYILGIVDVYCLSLLQQMKDDKSSKNWEYLCIEDNFLIAEKKFIENLDDPKFNFD